MSLQQRRRAATRRMAVHAYDPWLHNRHDRWVRDRRAARRRRDHAASLRYAMADFATALHSMGLQAAEVAARMRAITEIGR